MLSQNICYIFYLNLSKTIWVKWGDPMVWIWLHLLLNIQKIISMTNYKFLNSPWKKKNYPTQEWNIPSYLTKGNVTHMTQHPWTPSKKKKNNKVEPHLLWKWVHPSLIPPPHPLQHYCFAFWCTIKSYS